MPVVDRIAGFTKMMYDIVRKVVTPAITSVRTEDPSSFILKYDSSTYDPLLLIAQRPRMKRLRSGR
jgi:hypothetical protein